MSDGALRRPCQEKRHRYNAIVRLLYALISQRQVVEQCIVFRNGFSLIVSNLKEPEMTGTQVVDITNLEINDIKVASTNVIHEALSIIDSALSDLVKRELVSTSEVSDMLLDIRNLLTTAGRG